MYKKRVDFGATVRWLNEYDLDNSYVSGAVDVGMNVWKFVWVTVGYSYDEFDADLAGQDYSGQGFFVKFRFKFDENTLDSLKF